MSAVESSWRCPDCGHKLTLRIEASRHGARAALTVGVSDLTRRMKRHVALNPEMHPTFARDV